MRVPLFPRVVYCGKEDTFFKKLSNNADDFLLEARNIPFSSSPQKFAKSRKASLLILKINKEFDLKHQEWLSRNDASVPILILCQNGTIQTAIHALQYGVHDYFSSRQGLDVILDRVRDAIAWKSPRIPKRHPETEGQLLYGKNPEILKINEQAKSLARDTRPLLLCGETGTGKEHLAYGMYQLGYRKRVPFVRYDCRLLQEICKYDGLPVPELLQKRVKKFRKRLSAGVFFLSHLEQLNREQQLEILAQGLDPAIRLIASCECHRSAVHEEHRTFFSFLRIPPLRHHKDDIPILAEHFIRMTAQRRKLRTKSISEDALLLMQEYPWPGNLQELVNVIERMMVIEPSPVLTASSWLISQGSDVTLRGQTASQFSILLEDVLRSCEVQGKRGLLYDEFMQRVEKSLIELVLPKVGHNQALAARILGISRNTLREKMRA